MTVLYLGALLSRIPTPYFLLPCLLFKLCFFLFFFIYVAAITPAGSPKEARPACTELHSEMDLLIYPLSFSFPRNVTRFILMTWLQTTTDRTWGKASTVLLYLLTELLRLRQFCCGLWTRLALWVLVHRRKKAGRWDDECVSVCVHACKHVHVFYFPDFHSHIICHRIIQRFHFSSKYLFIIPSVSLSPDVLLHKLVEAL